MAAAEDNPPVPNWLLKLEEQREKRLKAKLGHEAGAGAPCQVCGDRCPGLDLHFWRKICKVCKCKKEEHDVNEDDIYGFIQFQLLGSKPSKAKSVWHKDAVVLDWTPIGANNDVKRYLDELPVDMLPVKGSDAARLRKQRLQRQMPAHDVDASLCHALTEDEIKELEEYVAHIRKHSVGQGKVIQLSLQKAQKHQMGQPNAQFLTQYAPGQLASSQTVLLQPSDVANNLQNLRLSPADKTKPRLEFLNSQLPNDAHKFPNYDPKSNTKYVDAQNPVVPKDVQYNYPVNDMNAAGNENPSIQVHYADENVNAARAKPISGYSAKTLHQVVDNQTPSVPKTIDLVYPNDNPYPDTQNYHFDPTNVPYPYQYTAKPFQNDNENAFWQNQPNYLLHSPVEKDKEYPLKNYPLTTSNVEKHQEQFENPNVLNANVLGYQNYPNDPEIPYPYPNKQPGSRNPIYFAENKVNPMENQQNISSVGFLRDIEYKPGKSDKNAENRCCHKCKKPFEEEGIAISVERTDALWHPNCFNCKTCCQPLADLMYFYHKDTDDVYCGRDYALLKGIPRCAACDELIFVREYCLAEDHTFHIKHFCCFECDDPLAGKHYLMENNQPVCLPCYEKLKADKCNDCGFVISADQQGVSLQELHWHADGKCFACKNCRKPLLGAKMLLRLRDLFCSDVCFKTYHKN